MMSMRVSELAQRSGVPATTLRYYEERGLLPAQRSPAGYRLYDERSVDRLAFITTAKQLGLELSEIGDLTGLWSDESCRRVKGALVARLEEQLARAAARAADLEDVRGLLRAALDHLAELPDRDTLCDPGCAFLSPSASRTAGVSDGVGLPLADTGVGSCPLQLRLDFTVDRVHLHVSAHPDQRPAPGTPAERVAALLGALGPATDDGALVVAR